MVYDDRIARRIRALTADVESVREQPMFGGLAFLVNGNMAVAASGRGGIMVRVDPSESDQLIDSTAATAMVMRGRPARGWLRVAAEVVRDDAELATWVGRGVAFARALPAK